MRCKFITTVCAAVLASSSAEPATTVARIESDLSSKGGHYVIEHYFSCEGRTGIGYRLVESGDSSAVALGVQVLRYSDACVSELLQSALGVAMARAPTVVLPYVNTSDLLGAGQICFPFIDAEDASFKLEAARTRAKRALARVHLPQLEKQKAACLAEIERR